MSQEPIPPSGETPSKDVGKIFLEEVTAGPPSHLPRWRRILQTLAIPVLAIFTGLVMGGVIIVLSSPEFYAAWRVSWIDGIKMGWNIVTTAYGALFTGAFGDPARMRAALQSGNPEEIRKAFNPFLESLVASTPYIFGGLAVALGFRAGLFNIGAEGQLWIGAVFAAFVGYSIKGVPAYIHLPLAFGAAAIGGGIWGFIPGWLKAKTGGHEVINTIMMNYIAFRLCDWLLTGPLKRPNSFNPITPFVEESAKLPRFFGDPIRFHLGFFVALFMAWLVYWFLFKTKWGFDLRAVGANQNAARYSGMNVAVSIMLAMTLSGALAGMAGGNEVLGVNYDLAMGFSAGYGFDSIALALLGKSQPLGVVLSALLFGFLRNGATRMQLVAGVPKDIISVLQAFILIFVAAPAIIRTIYRLKPPEGGEEGVFSGTWK